MNTPPSPSIRAWAQRLLALKAVDQPAGAHIHSAVQVCEMVRISLAQFVGAEGFTMLLRRALVLACADIPSLQIVKVTKDGRLEGMDEFADDARKDADAATAITAHLLELLVLFIGESLALRLVSQAFPDASGQMIVEFREVL